MACCGQVCTSDTYTLERDTRTRCCRMLVFGRPESDMWSIMKQLALCCDDGQGNGMFTPLIHRHCLRAVSKTLHTLDDSAKANLSQEANQAIQCLNNNPGRRISEQTASAMACLWQDMCSCEEDTTGHFMDKIMLLSSDTYLPSKEDLRLLPQPASCVCTI